MKAIRNARIITNKEIIDEGVVLYDEEPGVIRYVGKDVDISYSDVEQSDAGGAIVGPGFVDIHCHAGGGVWAYEDVKRMAEAQLLGGTTTLLCTLYQDIPEKTLFSAAQSIRHSIASGEPGNILGIHMEGPYLSSKYGANADCAKLPDPEEYETYIKTFGDIIKQWTYAPELLGAERFAKRAREAGILLAIGHSEADAQTVTEQAIGQQGVRICTHITNATGTTPTPSRYPGTKEVSFDQACMLCDELFCEIINDSQGAHVRHDMIQLILKTIGIERAIGITDATAIGESDGGDVNIINGELYGSNLRMIDVARNFKNLVGLSEWEVFKICSENPARALGINTVGEISAGKKADIVILNRNFDLLEIILGGKTKWRLPT